MPELLSRWEGAQPPGAGSSFLDGNRLVAQVTLRSPTVIFPFRHASGDPPRFRAGVG
jgi:hypothetical protein